MRRLFAITFSLLLSWPALAEASAPDLALNPGFEAATNGPLPEGWHGDATIYRRDTSVKHSGEASLRYENGDATLYKLCIQPFAFEAGKRYEFSAWVKTEGVKGDDSGATLCVEFTDADGKYAGGAYCHTGAKGDSDWTQYSLGTSLERRHPCRQGCQRSNTLTFLDSGHRILCRPRSIVPVAA